LNIYINKKESIKTLNQMKLIWLFLFMILNCLCIVSTELITEINCPPGTRREPNVFNPGSPDVCIPEGALQ
jgi:hypothetical protein